MNVKSEEMEQNIFKETQKGVVICDRFDVIIRRKKVYQYHLTNNAKEQRCRPQSHK